MATEHEARLALQKVFDQVQKKIVVRHALLGDSNGNVAVPNRDGWAFVRYRDDLNRLSQVHYLLPNQLPDGMPVTVGKKYVDSSYEEVLGIDWDLYAWSPSASNVRTHATQVVDVDTLSPGRVCPTDPVSLSVGVRAFLYINGDTAVEFGGDDIDLTASVPGIAGHRFVLVYMDLDTDALASADGTIVAVGSDPSAPATPENAIPLGLVDLTQAQASIDADDIYQYKSLYDGTHTADDGPVDVAYARGVIIRGGATGWEAYDASGDGYALIGDGTDIISTDDPTWTGQHTWSTGPQTMETGDANLTALIINIDPAQAVDAFYIHNGTTSITGFDERGVLWSDLGAHNTNFFAGNDAGKSTAGLLNTGVGREVLKAINGGTHNSMYGANSGASLTSGIGNCGHGYLTLQALTDGDYNTAHGYGALGSSVSDNNNTAIGRVAGYNTNGASNVIYLGAYAGYRQTNTSNILLVDNQQRADIATELTHSIIYGTMGANPEDQQLTINVDSFTIGTDADSDVVMNWVANTNSGVITWMEDEDYFLFGDDIVVPAYERHVQFPAMVTGTPANQPTEVDFGTASGLQFASVGAEYAFFQFEVGDDWDGVSDMTIEIDWFPDSGAMAGADTVKWDIEYRSIAPGETVTNGVSVTVSVTDDGDYAQYVTEHTPFTLDYDHANQPLTKEDHVFVKVTRDTGVANDFAGTVTITAFEVLYDSIRMPASN